MKSLRAWWAGISWLSVKIASGFLLMGLLGGLATAFYGKFAVLFFSVLVLGSFALIVPVRGLVYALYVVSFLVAGQLIYFARIDKALWFPFLIGAVLLIRFPFDLMRHSGLPEAKSAQAPALFTGVKIALIVYFLTLIASTAINQIPPLQLLVSGKEYFFLWAVLLVFAFGLVGGNTIQKIWFALPWLMPLQIPFVLYQRFVVAPSRAVRRMGAEWDAIVGAFGGDPEGGGSSGAMGLFCVIAITLVISRWRRGLIPAFQAVVLILSGLVALALGEVKFAVMLLPLAFLVLYSRNIMKKPVEGILAIGLAFVLSASVLLAYKTQFSNDGEKQSVSEYLSSVLSSRSNDGDFINFRTGEVGRVASIKFWWKQHSMNEPDKLLIGHGAGASRIGDLVVGEAARKWSFNIARSALVILLWEVGLIGACAFLAMLVFAFVRAYLLSNDPRLTPKQQATCASMAVAFMVFLAGAPYNTDLMFAHQIQLLLMLCLGYLAQLNGLLAGQQRWSVPAPLQSTVRSGPRLA